MALASFVHPIHRYKKSAERGMSIVLGMRRFCLTSIYIQCQVVTRRETVAQPAAEL